ncbi:MAG: isoaspartyl peptidase/L-asparaginase [Nitrospinae bacterium]|nr:isoaspartyl peptidase/L-asparaginase [Nitrospinota bacterium]
MTDKKKIVILTHGGAGSDPAHADGTAIAGQMGMMGLQTGESILDAACNAVISLEDDSRFNAGVGSHRRIDGSVQMDASCMDSSGTFGAVAALEGFRNPVQVARIVSQSEYRVLAGAGAAEFAANQGCKTVSLDEIGNTGKDFSTTDTVGCVIRDGDQFAAALSTGGIDDAIPGRVGDVPLIGCGLYAGVEGAVAATGDGEAIALQMTAFRAYQLIEQGMDPKAIVPRTIGWFKEPTAFGILVVSKLGFAGGTNKTMAWTAAEIEIPI